MSNGRHDSNFWLILTIFAALGALLFYAGDEMFRAATNVITQVF
jgi:hypothetical protein